VKVVVINSDVVRRRRRVAGVVVGLTVVAVIAAVAVVVGNRHDHRGDSVQVRSPAATSIVDPGTESSEPPPTAVDPSSTTTGTDATVDTQSPPGPAWEASQTTGLGNLDPVTIHATGMPQGGYAVGQCPPGAGPPDFDGCQLTGDPSVAYPVNGEFTSTVRVERWMLDGTVDCGRAPGTCVVGFMNISKDSGFTPVGFPISSTRRGSRRSPSHPMTRSPTASRSWSAESVSAREP
jgi:hypothetical protein